jgi:hypothetical protein
MITKKTRAETGSSVHIFRRHYNDDGKFVNCVYSRYSRKLKPKSLVPNPAGDEEAEIFGGKGEIKTTEPVYTTQRRINEVRKELGDRIEEDYERTIGLLRQGVDGSKENKIIVFRFLEGKIIRCTGEITNLDDDFTDDTAIK